MGPKLLTTSLIAVLSLGVVAARADDKKPADAPHGPRFTGGILADARADLSSRVAGAVDKVNVNEGDRVKKGQVLIELDAPELKDDLLAANAKLDQAKAEVEQAEAAVLAAKARLNQASAVRSTAEDAYKSAMASPTATPESVLTETRGRFTTAQAAREAAAAELVQTQAGVKIAQAGVEIAQAGVRRAETRLSFTKIHAPFDGVVGRLTVDGGTTVAPQRQGESAPLITVLRDDVVQVYFDVDERSIPQVKVGAPVVVRLANGSEIQGKVTRMAGTVVPNTGALRAYVALPNPDGKLKPGMFANVEVKTDGARP